MLRPSPEKTAMRKMTTRLAAPRRADGTPSTCPGQPEVLRINDDLIGIVSFQSAGEGGPGQVRGFVPPEIDAPEALEKRLGAARVDLAAERGLRGVEREPDPFEEQDRSRRLVAVNEGGADRDVPRRDRGHDGDLSPGPVADADLASRGEPGRAGERNERRSRGDP